MVSHSDHLGDSDLALRAMGEPLSAAATDHLQRCARCAAEVDQYAAVVGTARSLSSEDNVVSPPAHVWQAISAELDLGQPQRVSSGAPDATPPASDTETSDLATVHSLADRRRRWSTGILVAASMAGVLAGGVLALGGSSLVGGDQPAPSIASPAPDVVGSTSLVALPDHEGSGAAKVVQTEDGAELVVDVDQLTAVDGFYEVWLIDPDTFEMVGLGALNNNEGRFSIPDGLDLSKYRVVDVSIEPFDGDPVHSKDSVIRGEISV